MSDHDPISESTADEPEIQPATETRVDLPGDLPPVEPPSAGMIIQLFLVPALIVAVIVGVYTAFGSLASQELDWRQLVMDVQSENPHVRWRGALGMAQMLDADAQRGESTQNLAANQEIANALAEVYNELIRTSSDPSEEETKQIEFLSKALGRMTVQDVVIPVFRKGIQANRPIEIRKHSLIGLAMHAGSVKDGGKMISNSELVDDLIDISRESDSKIRNHSAFNLGLVDSEAARSRLKVLLLDPDQMTQVNAAIALARNGSVEGLSVFQNLIRDAVDWKLDPSQVENPEQEEEYFERMLMLTNGLKAVQELNDSLTSQQRNQIISDLKKLRESTSDAGLRVQISEISAALSSGSGT